MAQAYPSARTDTAQDLMRVVTRAYEDLLDAEGVVLPKKHALLRLFLEPLARAGGMLVAAVFELLPADRTVALHNKLFSSLTGGRNYPFEASSAAITGARALAARLEKESGKAPALLAAISHPPVMGELAHLNIELVRHAVLALREVRGRPCRPRLVAAIDPFALDTLGLVEEGVYAGFMGTFHLGLDRLALGRRGQLGPLMSPQTRWDRMPLRLLRTLAEGGEVGMVLSGGIPATGRVLYGAREWARRALAAGRRKDLSCLRRDETFARFEKAGAGLIPVPRRGLRLLEAWLMVAASGLTPGETVESAAAAALDCLDVPEAARAGLLADLSSDMTRETPARRRLFKLLVGRVARRRPLVLVPVIHSVAPNGVTEREAWGVTRISKGRVRVVRAGRPGEAEEMSAEELALRFTKEHFA